MYNPNLNQDQEAQLIANEMLAAAKEERQQKLAARRVARIIKIIATIIVIVAIIVVVRPLFSAETARDKKRKESLSEISKEISSYKSNHRNNLPMETSTKQWEREFIEPYLKDKDFFKDPVSGGEYRVVINEKKTANDIKDINDAGKIFVDQSSECAETGNINPAGSAVATLRIKLESGEVYCVNAG